MFNNEEEKSKLLTRLNGKNNLINGYRLSCSAYKIKRMKVVQAATILVFPDFRCQSLGL